MYGLRQRVCAIGHSLAPTLRMSQTSADTSLNSSAQLSCPGLGLPLSCLWPLAL